MSLPGSAANALLAGIHDRLANDESLTALVGEGSVRDRVTSRPQMPCVMFGEMESRDASSDASRSEEHFLTLEIWSEQEGRREAQVIAARVKALLDDAELTLDSAHLVSLRHLSSRSVRETKSRHFRIEMRFRALTE